MIKKLLPWTWIILGVLAILLQLVFKNFPEWTEEVYSRGVFLIARQVLDLLFGWLPVPGLYLFILISLPLLIIGIFRQIRKGETLIRKIWNPVFLLLSFVGGVIFFFFLLWGYNYQRLPIETTLGLDLKPLEKEELLTEFSGITEELIAARSAIPQADTNALTEQHLPTDFRLLVRKDLSSMLEQLGYPSNVEVPERLLKPKGVLLRISTAGFYFPLTGESNIDGGLHPIQIPSTLSHELSHGMGFGDEGTCNFLAYLACAHSEHPFIRYSGILGYWRYLDRAYRKSDPENYRLFWLGPRLKGIGNDLKAIRLQMDKYPDIFPEVRDFAYNSYLKSQGIKEGIQNYSRIVLLASAWNRQQRVK